MHREEFRPVSCQLLLFGSRGRNHLQRTCMGSGEPLLHTWHHQGHSLPSASAGQVKKQGGTVKTTLLSFRQLWFPAPQHQRILKPPMAKHHWNQARDQKKREYLSWEAASKSSGRQDSYPTSLGISQPQHGSSTEVRTHAECGSEIRAGHLGAAWLHQ